MKKFRPIRFVVHVAMVALVLVTVPWFVGAGLAATGDTVVPPPTPDAIVMYVQSYGWIVGLIALAYVVTKYLLKVNDSKHWIAQGRVLAAITAAVGVLGTGLVAYTSGTPWSGVLATGVLGVLHLVDAQVAVKTGGES